MLKSRLWDYSDAYILLSGTITFDRVGDDDNAKWLDKRNKGVIIKNCAPSTTYICVIDNSQIDLDNEQVQILWCRCII